MAKIESLIPFLILWESGVADSEASPRELFMKAGRKGTVCDPADRGGATLVGITIGTYKEYCRRKGRKTPSASDLRLLNYEEWLDILKTMFWDRWLADDIRSQKIANFLVDWVWTSGSFGITIPQRLLGVTADGIVGQKTLSALNARDPDGLLPMLRRERSAYIDRICAARPANLRFRSGWLRRINAIN